MFSTPVSILLACTAVALLMHRIGVWATFRHLRRPVKRHDGALPPLSLLKPIKGLEEQLEENLRSFYEQDYPAPLQIVFASTEPDDPGIALARNLSREYPKVSSVFVNASSAFGLNPKVANMQGALSVVDHDHVLQSDANVRIAPGYLETLMREYLGNHISLLGSLVVGVGERSPGAILENLQITTFTAPAICMAKELANISCILGKAMLFRRSELEALGGLTLVKDILAEDFVLAEAYARAGHRVVLSTTTVQNVNVHTPVSRFLARHSRWLKMRAVVSVPGFIADLCANPSILALAAWLISGFDIRMLFLLAAVLSYKIYWDGKLIQRLRGHPMPLPQRMLSPVRDAALAMLWVYALFSRSTEWRGQKLLLGRGSVLYANDGTLPVRLMRRLGLTGRRA